MFKWVKKGQIWSPSLENQWTQEYGQNPNAVVMDDRIRIYFSSRRKSPNDGKYMSYIFFVDVDKTNPSKIIATHEEPILNTTGQGVAGQFDEFGTMPGSILWREAEKQFWLYYVGWSRSNELPYKWANNLAVSPDGVTFEKMGNGKPIISPTYDYPYLHACPRVMQVEDNRWVMWYASGLEWYKNEEGTTPIYVLMHATSTDGINWDLSQQQTIPSVRNKECQSSASVIKHNDAYHMFFSYRDVIPGQPEHKQYRVGYAESQDLVNWKRDDSQAGIDVSESGWDSEAVCYPHVVEVDDKIYMFYSGNQYGRSGFGYAELVK
jgi:sucrose-6-phosphate hydrolase SacC (GH32 family)